MVGNERAVGDEGRHVRAVIRWRNAPRWTRALAVLLMLAALAMGTALAARPAHASPYTVCASGCPYFSINDAVAAAAPGATITVGPGTYGPNESGATTTDSPIHLSKPVTLVGAGIGKSIINDAPANQGTATVGVVQITPGVAGNTTVSGFTIEGAIVNDQNDDGILMTVSDTRSSDTITVKNNLFYSDSTLDPTNQLDQTDSIYVYGNDVSTTSAAKVNITSNTFKGVFRAALIEGFSGAFSFTGNDLSLHGLYDPSVPSQLDYWAEGMLFLSDGGFDIAAPQVVSGNTFESYDGMGIGLDAGYSGALVGALSNVSITGNTFKNLGVAAAQSSIADDAAIFMHGFGTSNGSVTSSIWGVTIKNNVFKMSSSSGHGYGIALKGALGGPISIDHNAVLGSGSSHPLAGIDLITPNSTTGLSITNTIVSGFSMGLNSDALPSGAVVSATQDCIMGNSVAGASIASGVAVAADHTWWGASSGPHATSNATGTGNAANGSVTFAPYRTSPATICAGPVASAVKANPNPAPAHSTFTLTSTLSDATTGNFAISTAEFNIDGGSYYPLYPQDGSFNQVTEVATGRVSLIGVGTFTLCVRGTDAMGDVGATTCAKVTIQSAATATPGTTATATVEATDTPTATTTEPTATPGATATPQPQPTPPGSDAGGGFPVIPVLIGVLVLLILAGLFVLLALGRRRRDNEQ